MCNFFIVLFLVGLKIEKILKRRLIKQEMKILICPFRALWNFDFQIPGLCHRAKMNQACSLQNK